MPLLLDYKDNYGMQKQMHLSNNDTCTDCVHTLYSINVTIKSSNRNVLEYVLPKYKTLQIWFTKPAISEL